MPHFFDKRDPWGHRLGLWVLVCMAFALPLTVWGFSRIKLDDDVESWIADDSPQTRQYRWYQAHFGHGDSIFASWDGSAVEDSRLKQFADRLVGKTDSEGVRRGGLPQISAVIAPGTFLSKMADAQIERPEALERISGIVVGRGPIWCQFSTSGLNQRSRSLRQLQEQAAKKFGINLKIEDQFGAVPVAEDEDASSEGDSVSGSAEIAAADDATVESAPPATEEVEIAPHDFQVSWTGMHSDPKLVARFMTWARELKIPVAGQREGEPLLTECFIHAGQPAAVIVALSDAGRADRSGTLEQIRRIAEQAGIPREKLHLAGTPVATEAINRELRKAIWNSDAAWYQPQRRSAVLSSLIAGIILTFWMLRNTRLSLIVLFIASFSTLSTVALVPILGGSVNTVLSLVPALLLVVTLLGTVRMSMCWRLESQRDPRNVIVQSVLSARIPFLLAVAATVLAMSSLLMSPLAPLREFGFYSAIGTLTVLAGVWYGVPALLRAFPPRAVARTKVRHRPWTQIGRTAIRHSTVICVGWLLFSAAAIYGVTRLQTETRSLRSLSAAVPAIQDYRSLENSFGGVIPVEIVVSFSRAEREELNFAQRLEVIRGIEQKLRSIRGLSGTLSLAAFHPPTAALPEDASIKETRAYSNRAKSLEATVRNDALARSFCRIAKSPSEFNAAGDELWRITTQCGTLSAADNHLLLDQLDFACRSITKYHAGTRHTISGMIPLYSAAQQSLSDSLLFTFLWALAPILVALLWVTRDLAAALLAMLINAVPVASAFGLVSWSQIPLDAGTLLTASIALALTFDGTLHLLTWYRNGLNQGLSRRRAVVCALDYCGPATWMAGMAVTGALAVLTTSSILAVNRFGWILSLLSASSMSTSILLGPAMLAGPLGRLIYLQVEKQRNKLKAVIEDPDPGSTLRHTAHAAPPKPQIAAESRPDTQGPFEQRDSRQRKRRR